MFGDAYFVTVLAFLLAVVGTVLGYPYFVTDTPERHGDSVRFDDANASGGDI